MRKDRGREAPRRFTIVIMIPAVIAGAALWPLSPPGREAAAQVYGVALPDLWNKTLLVRPKKAPAGAEVEIHSAVRNLGAADLAPAPSAVPDAPDGPAPPDAPPTAAVRFVLVANVRHREGIEAGFWGFAALEQRAVVRHAALWTVPADLAPGLWFLCADVDPENRIRESNEMNNRTCTPLTVETAPEVTAAAGAATAEEEREPAREASGERAPEAPGGEPPPQ